MTISDDPNFKNGPKTYDISLENFTKPHVFQKITVDLIGKSIYFKFHLLEDCDGDPFLKIIFNFGQSNYNDIIRRQVAKNQE